MSLLIIRLITFLNAQSPETTTYHIALTMLENYDKLHQLSITDVAKLCNVSKSTISKFARQLGFDDYLDLKDNATFVENRFNNPLNYLSNILTSIQTEGIDDYLTSVIKDITYLQQHLDLSAIDRLVNAMINHRRVYAFGLVFSESAAIDLQYKLAYNGKFIQTFQDDVLQERILEEATDDTLVIIFTNSGDYLTKQQIHLGTPRKNVFMNTAAHVIAVTANPNVKNFSFIDDAIVFPHQTHYQTHSIMYQIITDLIVTRYREFKNTSSYLQTANK